MSNHDSTITVTKKDQLQSILSMFPKETKFAFGYGSGVFINENSMIDMILCVENVTKWHDTNLATNRDHYATLPMMLGSNFISAVQELGAGCYFNPMVKIKLNDNDDNNNDEEELTSQRLVKYGVISESRLKHDLMEWDTMYIAGRMHKPTVPLETISDCSSRDEIIQLQEDYNLRFAVATGLLLLPHQKLANRDTTTVLEEDLYKCIAGLSYIGDPRMALGAEDPNKVNKLVSSLGQYDRFQKLYHGQLSQLEKKGLISRMKSLQGDVIEINLMDPATVRELHSNIPQRVQSQTMTQFSPFVGRRIMTTSESSIAWEDVSLFSNQLSNTMGRIIRHPARIQSIKGIVTAGVAKSVQYVSAKLSKGILRK